jgi:hypothetical protein
VLDTLKVLMAPAYAAREGPPVDLPAISTPTRLSKLRAACEQAQHDGSCKAYIFNSLYRVKHPVSCSIASVKA